MTTTHTVDQFTRVLVGFDASRSAMDAVGVAARLIPGASATVVHLWNMPVASPELRQRLAGRAQTVERLIELLEQEGSAEAERIAGQGAALARAAGWHADALAELNVNEGYQLARLAEQRDMTLVVLGSRGLTGAKAVLGSMSDMVVHVSHVPVLVVPFPLMTTERADLDAGPILIASDGSSSATLAAERAAQLFPDRERVVVTVDSNSESEVTVAGDDTVIRLPVRGRPGRARAVAFALGEYASERGAAAIVVGSRGRSAGRELLVGSVAKAVLHHTHRPVVVVPALRSGLSDDD